jgi:uncharacterized metal-binding protein YceD (DUF177 family)
VARRVLNALTIAEQELESPLVRSVALSGDDLLLEPGSAKVLVDVRCVKSGRTVIVIGTLHASWDAQCSSCLGPAEVSIEEPLRLSVGMPPSGQIDLSDDVRSAYIAAIPIRVVCSDSCRGLCPKCGADLSRAACRCGAKKPGDSMKSVLDRALGPKALRKR